MTERYDHRTAEAHAEDAEEEAVLDRPVMQGAADLRHEVEEAAEHGDLDHDPSSPPEPADPS